MIPGNGETEEPGKSAPGRAWALLDLAFPQNDRPKAEAAHGTKHPRVTRAVRLELGDPEGAIPFRRSRSVAADVAVPEATVHEDAPASGQVHDVWGARQAAGGPPCSYAELA